MKRFSVQMSSRLERHETIDSVKTILSASGAWVMDYKMYSNYILSLQFMITVRDLSLLRHELEESGFALFQESMQELREFISGLNQDGANGETEISGSLVVHFVHNDPDLLIEVPAVPG